MESERVLFKRIGLTACIHIGGNDPEKTEILEVQERAGRIARANVLGEGGGTGLWSGGAIGHGQEQRHHSDRR